MDISVATDLDTLLHQPVRTRLVAYLATHGETTFSDLKQLLEITDGNLDAHMKKLVAAKYVKVRKVTGKGRPQTFYLLTTKGQHAFEQYIDVLNRLLQLSGVGLVV